MPIVLIRARPLWPGVLLGTRCAREFSEKTDQADPADPAGPVRHEALSCLLQPNVLPNVGME